jgi:hypothetical protein
MFRVTRKLIMIAAAAAALGGTSGGAALAATSLPAAVAASSAPRCDVRDLSAITLASMIGNHGSLRYL